MSSFVSAKGPSVTWGLPAGNVTRAPFELGWSPAPSSSTPDFTSSSLYFPMTSRSLRVGRTPASVILSAFSNIMNRIQVPVLTPGRTAGDGIDGSTILFRGRLKAVKDRWVSIPAFDTRHASGGEYVDDYESAAVDRSGPARVRLSVCRRNKAGAAGRGDARARRAARTVAAVHRRGRSAWCNRPDPSRTPADPSAVDATGGLRARHHHDRRRRRHPAGWRWRAGGHSADSRTARGVRRLRPVAAGTPGRFPGGQFPACTERCGLPII